MKVNREPRLRALLMGAALVGAALVGAALVGVALGGACGPGPESLPPDVPRESEPTVGDPIDHVLGPRVTPGFQSQVLVLGTLHLSGEGGRLEPGHLASLLDLLERFEPTRIAVESLTAHEVALLAELEAEDPAAAQVLDMFARAPLTAGRTMQGALGLDRSAAGRLARAPLEDGGSSLTDGQRLALVGWFLAAYELNSAVLQWSYLSPESRRRDQTLPAEIRDLLDRRLESANEVITLASALARRLGLQRLYSVDSQYDGVRTLSAPEGALETLFSDPLRGELRDREWAARGDSVKDAAFGAGDLLPLYRWMNGQEYQRGDLTQWNWLFEGRHPDGLDRFRYAMWELRNIRQATHIMDVAASGRPERVLVVVGASHKPHLDRVLGAHLSVRTVQLADLETAGAS
jgi:hypothetical protein